MGQGMQSGPRLGATFLPQQLLSWLEGEAAASLGEYFARSLPEVNAAAARPQGQGPAWEDTAAKGSDRTTATLQQQQQSEIVAAIFVWISQHTSSRSLKY